MAEVTKPLLDPDRIVKEVWKVGDIPIRTELNIEQIRSVNLSTTLSMIFGSEFLDEHLKNFMTLQVSKDRKGRYEFVEALKSKKDELIEKSKTFHLLG